MPETEQAEPLKKTAVAVTPRQWRRLRQRGKREQRSFSYYVRTALDHTFPEAKEGADDGKHSAA